MALPRTRTDEEKKTDSPQSVMGVLRDNLAARAVILGASGLGMVGGLMAATPAEAVTVDTQDHVRETARYKGVVYLGMNEGASHEVSHLRGRVGYNGVKFIKPSKVQDQIIYDGVKYDLASEDGRDGFVAALGLTGDKATALSSLLGSVGSEGRDEMAQLAVVFDQAQRGERFIERIAFSGHSVGSSVWGDDNGSVTWDNVGKLALIFPKAAGQVEDVLVAACYSGGESTMDKYRGIFPNVKTIWAYDGTAPGAASGATAHITRWDRGTRGETSDRLSRDSAKHTRKGEYVAVWSDTKGYDNGKEPNAIEVDRSSHDASHEVVSAFLSGESVVTSPQSGPLRSHYNTIQRMLGRGDVPAAERAELEQERDVVIRMLYFKNVSGFFQDVHAPSIATGFSDLGLDAPDFSTMSRKQALETIEQFNGVYDSTDSPSETATYMHKLLNDGLKDLSSSLIPEAWI